MINSNTKYDIRIEPNVLLFGYFDTSNKHIDDSEKHSALNLLLILVKRFIYVSRCKENLPTMEGLNNFLNHHVKIDYHSAKDPIEKWCDFRNFTFFPVFD